jgi:hypothetical protein
LLQRLKIYEGKNNDVDISKKLWVYYTVVKIATTVGVSLLRWQQITTCMIEKVKGVPRIDKLRVIHLFEADYNLLLKIIWARKTVWNAHTQQRLNNGQSGSRPNRRAINVVLTTEMNYLYARLTRTNLATIDKDAKSCFDRILCNLAMLISRYYGVPMKFCKVQSKTLEESIFRLKTALGVSNICYKHSKDTPIHGTGRGSCSSPAIWLLVSSFLMDIFDKKAKV